jgi:hypothetical protein
LNNLRETKGDRCQRRGGAVAGWWDVPREGKDTELRTATRSSRDAPERRIGPERGGGIRRPACAEEATGWNTELVYLMIPARKPGLIAPSFGLFAENRRNCLSMNILHINGSLSNGAQFKVNQGQSRLIKVNKGIF